MDDIVFIGDELGAIAYGLAGVSVNSCDPGETRAVLDSLAQRDGLRLVILGARHAHALGIDELANTMKAGSPPLMVVADTPGTMTIADFPARMRRRLGVAT